MAISPGPLQDISGVGDAVSVAQNNFEDIALDLYGFNSTRQNGTETTLIGPPTSGTFTSDDRWVDAWGAHWRCTAGGTPGTWRQETPAVREGEPGSGTIPSNYLIRDANDRHREKYHAGSYVWVQINEDFGAANAAVNETFDILGDLGSAGGIYWRSGDNVACTGALTGILRGAGASGPEAIGSLTANRIARIGTSGQTLSNSIARDDGTYFSIGADPDTGQLVFQVTGGISLIGESTVKTSVGELTLDTGNSLSINFKIGGSNGWRITSASILESIGAQTLRTSTGNLTLATGAANGHIILSPHGSGNVGIGTTSPAGKLVVYSGSAGAVTANTSADDLIVENNGPTGISILSPDASSSLLRFGSPSDNVGAEIYWNHDQNTMMIATSKTGGYIQFRTGNENDAMRIDTNGNVGIGTTGPDRLTHAEASDSATNTVTYAQRLSHITSGTAAGGFGVGVEFENENSTGSNVVSAYIESILSTVGASWLGDLILKAADSGGAREFLRGRGSGSAAQIAVLGATPISRQAHIVDADGTLADITTKFNTLLSYVENFGFVATS